MFQEGLWCLVHERSERFAYLVLEGCESLDKLVLAPRCLATVINQPCLAVLLCCVCMCVALCALHCLSNLLCNAPLFSVTRTPNKKRLATNPFLRAAKGGFVSRLAGGWLCPPKMTGENILVNIRHSRFVIEVYNVLVFGANRLEV